MEIKELLTKRAELKKACEEVLNRAVDGVLKPEDRETYDKQWADMTGLTAEIDERNAHANRIEQLEKANEWESKVAQRNIAPSGEKTDSGEKETRKDVSAMRAYGKWLRGDRLNDAEYRALGADSAGSGAELLPPYEFINNVIIPRDRRVWMRTAGTVKKITDSAQGWIPTVESNPADADWTAEIPSPEISPDSTMATGKRVLKPNALTKEVDVSKKELQIMPEVAELVAGRLGYKFGVSEEKGFLLGSGSGQPLGLFVASANGIPTSRDVTIDTVSNGVISMDGMKALKYACDPVYWADASYVAHPSIFQQVATLKDTLGRYLWQPAVVAGQPDVFDGIPCRMSSFAPNATTAGSYGMLFGALSYYWIAELVNGLTIQRLVEVTARSLSVGFLGSEYVDGMPVLAEAFARGKFSGSSS